MTTPRTVVDPMPKIPAGLAPIAQPNLGRMLLVSVIFGCWLAVPMGVMRTLLESRRFGTLGVVALSVMTALSALVLVVHGQYWRRATAVAPAKPAGPGRPRGSAWVVGVVGVMGGYGLTAYLAVVAGSVVVVRWCRGQPWPGPEYQAPVLMLLHIAAVLGCLTQGGRLWRRLDRWRSLTQGAAATTINSPAGPLWDRDLDHDLVSGGQML